MVITVVQPRVQPWFVGFLLVLFLFWLVCLFVCSPLYFLNPLFQKHNILNVYDSYTLELGVFMYQYINGSLPISFNAFFTKLSDIHNYDTRNKSNYNPTRNKKVFADKAIRTMGPILWNLLDKNIKKSKSTNHFRKLYKSSLISNYI